MADEDAETAFEIVEEAMDVRDAVDLSDLRLDELPDLISSYERLEDLSIRNTQITHLEPIGELKRLITLDIGNTPIRDLTPIRGNTELERIDLDETQVADLSPLADSLALQSLDATKSQVTNLTPLARLERLREVDVSGCSVTDISPLRDLPELQILDLSDSAVEDLRPLLSFKCIAKREDGKRLDIDYAYSGAYYSDEELRRIRDTVPKDQRLDAVLEHLRTLPPWPAPLWEGSQSSPSQSGDIPNVPDSVPAPLDAVVVDGVLRPSRSTKRSDQSDATREAWHALKDTLADLADLGPKIDNAMPSLGRALRRVEAALGNGPQDCRIINLGLHANRVIALSPLAPDALMDEDAVEITILAQNLAQYLDQFPEWRAYLDSGPAPTEEEVESVRDDLIEVTSALDASTAVDPAIPAALRDLIDANKDAPDDTLSRRGLIDSFRNIIAGAARWLLGEVQDVGSM